MDDDLIDVDVKWLCGVHESLDVFAENVEGEVGECRAFDVLGSRLEAYPHSDAMELTRLVFLHEGQENGRLLDDAQHATTEILQVFQHDVVLAAARGGGRGHGGSVIRQPSYLR